MEELQIQTETQEERIQFINEINSFLEKLETIDKINKEIECKTQANNFDIKNEVDKSKKLFNILIISIKNLKDENIQYRINMLNHAKIKLKNTLNNNNNAINKNIEKRNIKIKIIDSDFDTEANFDFNSVLKQKILNEEVKTVNSKNNQVISLEKSVNELHNVFNDFAILTAEQGEHLDNIEYHVKQSDYFITEGNKNLQHSINYIKNIRKYQFYIIIGFLMVIFIIVGVVFSQK